MKQLLKKGKSIISTLCAMLVMVAMAVPTFAAANTGNTDLDGLIDSMETGLDTIKTGGLYIVAAVIVIAVVFLGARWLWNMFRGWLAKAQ